MEHMQRGVASKSVLNAQFCEEVRYTVVLGD